MELALVGNYDAEILVVCEPKRLGDKPSHPMNLASLKLLNSELSKVGISSDNVLFAEFCPTIPVEIIKSESRKAKWVKPYSDRIEELLTKISPKVIVTLGDLPTKNIYGKNIKFTGVRGNLIQREDGKKVFPMTSPSQALSRPEHMPVFASDVANLANISRNNYEVSKRLDRVYEWCEDLSELISIKPNLIAIDTETTGLDIRAGTDTRILTVQISYKKGHSYVCPINREFWDWKGREDKRLNLISQIKQIMSDRSIKKVGQNIAYDIIVLENEGILVSGIYADTELWAWAVDENIIQKNIDNLCKVYLPEYSGYNDEFNATIDKSDMMNVDKAVFLRYAGGDTDATLQLFYHLDDLLSREPSQKKLITKVKMPCLVMLMRMTQRGVLVDLDHLDSLKPKLHAAKDKLYEELIQLVPKAVISKHFNEGLKFTRSRFVVDIMFSKEGFNLKPILFTESTADLPAEDRIPSVSAKNHFPYFIDVAGPAGEFAYKFTEYVKLEKLLSTYVDSFAEDYVGKLGSIHSNFSLSRATTGRTSSSNPNSQVWPARGPYAKEYKKIVKARPGYSFVSADLSQIELRLVAHVSRDDNMIQLYRQDADIHSYTARASLGASEQYWELLPKEDKKLFRFKAKAVNFGRVYGMGDKKFRVYAKTDYGIDYSEREAKESGERFFASFPRLRPWHNNVRTQVSKTGIITSLDGHVRHLPSVFSNDEAIRSSAMRMAINSPIQGTASNLGLSAMLRIARQGNPNIKPVLFIHDDCVLEVKEGYEWEAANALCWCMRFHKMKDWFGVNLLVPIKGEPDVGKNLGEMYELGDLPDSAPDWVKSIPKIDPLNPEKPRWWSDIKDI